MTSDSDFSMLVPLKDDDRITDDALAFGAELLRVARPLPQSESRKRRVWARLEAPSSTRSALGRRAVYAVVSFSLLAAASSAAVGYRWASHGVERLVPAPFASPAAPTANAAPAPPPHRGPEPAPLPATGTTESPPAASAEVPVPRVRQKSQASAKPQSSSTAAPSDAEAALLLRAMRARRSGNTEQAEALAAEYLEKHPRGALEEEALILSVEAAVTRKAPNAPALAREYLSRFPGGRFRAQAARAAASASPR